jgi:hypothetical protein
MTDKDKILEALKDVEYSATFAGPMKDRPNQLCWNIKIVIGNRAYETIYSEGVGHIPGYTFQFKRCIDQVNMEKYAVSTGKYYSLDNPSIIKPLPAPELIDVMYCLVSDAEAIEYQNFEEFADMLGYDPDSRKAEKVYNACLKVGLFLRISLGEDKLEELRELYQNF